MCGRYAIASPAEKIAERFDAALPDLTLQPKFNAAPSQLLPVIIKDGGNQLVLYKWGLVPGWAKDPSVGNRMINARAETIFERPAFRKAIRSKRCLVPANGFYEWQKNDARSKTPFYIHSGDEDLFAFAGIWEEWKAESGQHLYTFAIITKEAGENLKSLHHRMPVILNQESANVWMDEVPAADLENILEMAYPGRILYYPVSKRVNAVANDDESLIEPIPSS